MKRDLLVFAALFVPTGCDGGAKEQIGTLLGDGLGEVAGSQNGDERAQHLAIAEGFLIGSVIAHEVGKSLDRGYRLIMGEAHHHALENGRSGSTTDLAQSGQRQFRRRHAPTGLPYRRWYLLPGVSADRNGRQTDVMGLWNRLPTAGRNMKGRAEW